jgi:hypothetical protein
MRKRKILISEQDLVSLITKSILGGDISDILGSSDGKKTDNKPKSSQFSDSKPLSISTNGFTNLNLKNINHLRAYADIANKFIQSRSSNLLGLNGEMFANAAKKVFDKYGKYVPVELVMAQLATEGGFSNDPNARPIKTKNPFNVGNVDTGKNVRHSSVQSGIDIYYDLIAKNYLTGGKTATDLINNFVNKDNLRYASGKEYERMVGNIANQVKKISNPIYAALSKQKGPYLA